MTRVLTEKDFTKEVLESERKLRESAKLNKEVLSNLNKERASKYWSRRELEHEAKMMAIFRQLRK